MRNSPVPAMWSVMIEIQPKIPYTASGTTEKILSFVLSPFAIPYTSTISGRRSAAAPQAWKRSGETAAATIHEYFLPALMTPDATAIVTAYVTRGYASSQTMRLYIRGTSGATPASSM